jgi:outer membrane receptor protein involved in Fe transport
VSAQNVVNQCAAGNTAFCPFVIRDGTGTITEVDTPYLNLAKLKTSGLDIEGQYTLPLNHLSPNLPGTLNIDVLATYIAHLKTIQATGSLDIAGETGCSPTSALLCVPHWSVDMTANYTVNRLSLTAHGRYIDSGIYDVTLVDPQDPGYSIFAKNSINTNRIPGAFYLDLDVSYDVIKDGHHHVQMFMGVNNVTNKNPPLIPGRGNPVYFDVIGRYYKFGIRTSL